MAGLVLLFPHAVEKMNKMIGFVWSLPGLKAEHGSNVGLWCFSSLHAAHIIILAYLIRASDNILNSF